MRIRPQYDDAADDDDVADDDDGVTFSTISAMQFPS
jgi:hypothetical protein